MEPIRVKGNVEAAIRHNVLSKELINAATNFVRVASKGVYKPSAAKKISTPTYTGFERVDRYRTRDGYVYIAGRTIVQKDRGSAVVSIAKNRSVAVRNLHRFFAHTQISRR